jgi:thiazole synthase
MLFKEGKAMPYPSDFTIANKTFHSRLLIGSARYPDQGTMISAIEASEASIATVSIRRVNIFQSSMEAILQPLKAKGLHILPNTAGCYTAKEAVLTARLAREALETNWIKLEVIGDEKTLFPDVIELLKAADELVREGFIVLPYCNDDLITCRKLADLGCAAVMPLGSPIGSGMGILNPYNLQIIREKIEIPLILDAGIGTASDVSKAMELGFDGVLINTAIAQAEDPVSMAIAMKLACQAGRLAYVSGRIPKKLYATASSPLEGIIS